MSFSGSKACVFFSSGSLLRGAIAVGRSAKRLKMPCAYTELPGFLEGDKGILEQFLPINLWSVSYMLRAVALVREPLIWYPSKGNF